jgi:hypothetical protein
MLPFKPVAAMFERPADGFPRRKLSLMVEGACLVD